MGLLIIYKIYITLNLRLLNLKFDKEEIVISGICLEFKFLAKI